MPHPTPQSSDRPARGGSPSIERPEYWWYRARAELLRVALERYVGSPRRILDVGSADGPSVAWLRGRAQHVSLDLDPRGLQAPGGVCGSVLQLPFADGAFDVVTAFDVVEHCDPESRALDELQRVLAPGGRLLMSVPAYQWAWSDHDVANGHYRRYTRRRAVAAVEGAGLVVERATYAFAAVFPMFAGERLLRRARQRVAGTGPQGPADVVEVPQVAPAVERLLMGLTRLDERLLRRRDLPVGSSVLLAAVKPG
ncbi:MAG: methyltransferase domain-containing protein [Nocardioides sp.]